MVRESTPKSVIFIKFLKQYHLIIFILLAIFLPAIFKNTIPLEWKNIGFTFSVLLKEILMFLIPFLIFPLIVQSVLDMSSKGIYLVILLVIFTFFSNFFSMLISYGVGSNCIPLLPVAKVVGIDEKIEPISSLISINLLSFGTAETLLFGIISGLCLTYFKHPLLLRIIERYYTYSRLFLEKIFIFFLPAYIFGNSLKVIDEIDFISLLPIFGNMLLLLLSVQISYITLLFFIGTGFSFSRCITAIKNTFPALILSFLTMSSLITMPVTLKAAEKNTNNPSIARLTITTTVNFHDIGDCISLPFIALTIIYVVTGTFPEFQTYLLFAFFAAMAQFSAVSIPCGSIVIILPFLTRYLGLTDKMASLMMALSILIEPIGTAMNVMGNSAGVLIVNRLFKSLKRVTQLGLTFNKFVKRLVFSQNKGC